MIASLFSDFLRSFCTKSNAFSLASLNCSTDGILQKSIHDCVFCFSFPLRPNVSLYDRRPPAFVLSGFSNLFREGQSLPYFLTMKLTKSITASVVFRMVFVPKFFRAVVRTQGIRSFLRN